MANATIFALNALRKNSVIVTLLAYAALVGLPTQAKAQQVILGTSQNFAVLGASTVTNTGATVIIGGHVGVAPGTAITGFPPGSIQSPYTQHPGDPIAVQAHTDALTAYSTAQGLSFLPANNLSGQDLGGLTLTPGVYHFNTSAFLTGQLTLDNLGDPNAEFVFQIGSTLITASSSLVTLDAGYVYWQVGTSATLGVDSMFRGNVLADQSITVMSGASILEGRALAINAAVTLDTNYISATPVPEPATITFALFSALTGMTYIAKKFPRRLKSELQGSM